MVRAAQKRSYQRHAARRVAYTQQWRLDHPGRAAASALAWRIANPERRQEGNRHQAKLSKARRKGAVGTHTLTEWREKCELFANLCAYCGEARVLHREHKIPLIRGGTNYIENIIPACSPCNLKKRTRTAKEFLGLTA
jgi:5-methylcytosine-specific restriction endonuclease McrA